MASARGVKRLDVAHASNPRYDVVVDVASDGSMRFAARCREDGGAVMLCASGHSHTASEIVSAATTAATGARSPLAAIPVEEGRCPLGVMAPTMSSAVSGTYITDGGQAMSALMDMLAEAKSEFLTMYALQDGNRLLQRMSTTRGGPLDVFFSTEYEVQDGHWFITVTVTLESSWESHANSLKFKIKTSDRSRDASGIKKVLTSNSFSDGFIAHAEAIYNFKKPFARRDAMFGNKGGFDIKPADIKYLCQDALYEEGYTTTVVSKKIGMNINP